MEASKRVLAYQQCPLVLLCERSGAIPEDFLVSLTDDERSYVLARAESPLEPVFFDLLPRVGAAGVQPEVSSLLLDVFCKNPRLFLRVDDISLPLAEDASTQEWLVREYFEPFVLEIQQVVEKTKQRFGSCHLVRLAVLPRFFEGRLVEEEVVTFGSACVEGAVHEPAHLRGLVSRSALGDWCAQWTWVGVHPKFFSSASLTDSLVERLSKLSCSALVRSE